MASIALGCERCTSRLLAAGLFLLNDHIPQKNGWKGTNRPFGPAGMPWVHNCWAISGASRLATAQALGGFKISAPRPEISHLLLDALSHAGASGGKKRGEPRIIFECLTHWFGIDRDVAFGIDQHSPE